MCTSFCGGEVFISVCVWTGGSGVRFELKNSLMRMQACMHSYTGNAGSVDNPIGHISTGCRTVSGDFNDLTTS